MFNEYFSQATGHQAPYPFQVSLATSEWPDLLDIPTGLGKTAAVTLAWVYKRGWREGSQRTEIDPDTPRRLIWCLPMRVLVEQTEDNIRTWLANLGILGEPGEGKVSVHRLMGGEPDTKTWAEHPEEDMVLIGTQDMLLSRALMRGFGMSRYQWPVHFALLHNDCLWAYDEVQLMGAGLTTSAQLEAFRRSFALGKSSRSLWLSATLKPSWLATVDLAPHLGDFKTLTLSDTDHRRAESRLNASKALARTEFSFRAENNKKAGQAEYLDAFCEAVLAQHDTSSQTLIIVNRVERAQGLFRKLQAARPTSKNLLIHSRFRASERAAQNQSLRKTAADRIIVATQAIEAGVDISSKVMFTELAPWASLAQRFGRCNRAGEHLPENGAHVFWIDIEDNADPVPYETEALRAARDKLLGLHDVGPASLPATDEARPLTTTLRRKDLIDLFNTDPDLSGFDVDVSDYIRDTDNPGLQVFWRDFTDPTMPTEQSRPHRAELCPVAIGQAKNLHKLGAWRWDSLGGRWEKLLSPPRSGMVLMLPAASGGYDPALGFMNSAKRPVEVLPAKDNSPQDQYSADSLSQTRIPITLSDHLGNAARFGRKLCAAIGEIDHAADVIRADRWHDVGKAHEVFDASMHRCAEAPNNLLAKSNCPGPMRHSRKYFRHELASALAWLAQHDNPRQPDSRVDLIAYLIAAHHGKVRMSLRAMPKEKAAPDNARFARGIWEGDRLPELSFDGETSNETELKLALMEIGEGDQGRSWAARVLTLLEEHGPFRLAWLETLVRIADWRASAAEQLADRYDLDQNKGHGLENQHTTLATARSEEETADSTRETAAQSGAQHGLRRRTGGSGDAGTRAAASAHATRQIKTNLGVISYAELSPRLARRVERAAFAITKGEFNGLPLDENLIRELHNRICGDLTTQFAGQWRRINVLVGTHEPPAAALVAQKMRDYVADLASRIQHLQPAPGQQLLETLAFAEGRLLSIHPFEDFNGRTTRLFIDLLLQRLDLPAIDPIPAYGQPTDDYLSALRAGDRHNWRPLMDIWHKRLGEEGYE